MPTFTFNPSIPAPNDNPSADQPDMQNNYASTDGILNIDHVSFNLINGGQHKAITFNQDASYVPVPPVSPPQVFTNTMGLPGAIPQLFYYSGDAAHSSNQYVSSANGSTFLFGGIILKWGAAGLIGAALLFPVPFPNNCFTVLVVGTSTLYTGGFVVSSVSAAGFTVNRTSGSGSTGYYYVAIGN